MTALVTRDHGTRLHLDQTISRTTTRVVFKARGTSSQGQIWEPSAKHPASFRECLSGRLWRVATSGDARFRLNMRDTADTYRNSCTYTEIACSSRVSRGLGATHVREKCEPWSRRRRGSSSRLCAVHTITPRCALSPLCWYGLVCMPDARLHVRAGKSLGK